MSKTASFSKDRKIFTTYNVNLKKTGIALSETEEEKGRRTI